jgi:hypothetical protein
MRVIQERDVNNTPTVSYTRGTDLSGSIEGAGGIGGMLARSSGYSGGNWSTHYFYHGDGNGNITYLVDATSGNRRVRFANPRGAVPLESWAAVGPNLYRCDWNNPVNSLDPYGLWTFGVGITIGIQLGAINIVFSTGFTGDTQGHFGGFFTGGGGGGLGAGIFTGVSIQTSNAKCNDDLSGPFGYGSLSGAFGESGSIDTFWGNSNDGPVFGGGVTIGVGLGAGAAAGGTETVINQYGEVS